MFVVDKPRTKEETKALLAIGMRLRKEERKEKLSKLLETMDIPAMRKETLHLRSTLLWLNRNLAINNAGKPETTEALAIIKELMRGQ